MADSVAVTYDDDKIGTVPIWANRAAVVALFDSLSIAVGIAENEIGAVKVQGALSPISATIAESDLDIIAIDEVGNTITHTVPSIDYANSLKINIEELQTRYAELKVALTAAGVTV